MGQVDEKAKGYRRQGLFLAVFVFLLDQAVKYMVTVPLSLESRVSVEVMPFFNLTWAKNFGVSMGLLTAESPMQRWLLVALTGLIAAIVLVWMFREKLRGDIWALALILGGALGNIVDRVRLGYVVDYADLHFEWGGQMIRPFLIFNIADAAITIGVVLLLLRALLIGDKAREAAQEGAVE
ncbi:signal peptidase II [Alterisphingorhabdus coralli]|uniref:Lipoprotein signal peptidase n=1 Tax=Alterisphingorhabdus coralli TaxID=3071408 RepID=A0AA97I1S7_9SPHN|nr:signal peptidase II [Parasphingorhabdus sp. SCSIO 66989]WOE75600.1 signal peptidase II [Parasphingorhabdus sp. SCSIO 66989]